MSKGHSEESAVSWSSVVSANLSVVSKKLACIDLKENTQMKESRADKFIKTEHRSVVARGWG